MAYAIPCQPLYVGHIGSRIINRQGREYDDDNQTHWYANTTTTTSTYIKKMRMFSIWGIPFNTCSLPF